MDPHQINRLDKDFYSRGVLDVAPELIGKSLVVFQNKLQKRFLITEVEAYRGEQDLACHASKGRTPRTEIMYQDGGHVYVYLIYGMYWMLNIVTGRLNEPEAILIRGIAGFTGPGRLTRQLNLDGSYYGENLCRSERIWLEDDGLNPSYTCSPRIGIGYAGEPWVSMPWRFLMKP
jgi:DNA-3-methyladenine glycosylase